MMCCVRLFAFSKSPKVVRVGAHFATQKIESVNPLSAKNYCIFTVYTVTGMLQM